MLCIPTRHSTFPKIFRKTFPVFLGLLLITIFVLWTDTLSHAKASPAEETTSINEATQGTLLLRTATQERLSPAPTLHTNAYISVTGLIARTIVHQTFQNPGTDWAEGVYVFPLPETAAVDHLRMHIGERIIKGIIQERAQARKTYTKAKREGKKTSLIEQERPNMFTTSVANIGPNERITIEIEYQEIVRYEDGQFSLRFPMVVGPRYIPGSPERLRGDISEPDGQGWANNTHQVPDASRITPPVQRPDDGPINPISLTLDLAPGFPIADIGSSYHAIQRTKKSEDHYEIALREGEVPADRDFELIWKPTQNHVPKVAMFTEKRNKETYMLLMVMPPATVFADQAALPRDVTFVIDTSGSMYGTSIEQATLALQLALERLKSQDRFNIIQFNDKTHALFSSSQPVTSKTIQEATWYVQRLVAEGGTEMLPALEQALPSQGFTPGLRQVVFITDGQIGNEAQLFQSIQQHIAHTRLFTVGIGSAPNSHFMRNAAKYGRGTFTYIGHTAEVQDKMNELFQKLEHPVITDIELELPAVGPTEILPERIPDLYLGEPMMVAIRSTATPDQATVKGKIGAREWKTTLALHTASQRQGIAIYWARHKIMTLMDSEIDPREQNTRREQIIDIALSHHLVSRYTSLVAVDVTPTRSSDQTFSSHAMKTNLPYGQNYTKIFGLSAGATPGLWHLTLGLLFLLIASAGYQWSRTRS